MSDEHFKIIIEKAKKNITKYKIFKKTDINFISKTLQKYSKKNKILFFGNYAFNNKYPENKVFLYNNIPESRYNFIANPDITYNLYSSNLLIDIFNIINLLSIQFKYIKGYSSFNEFEYIIEINFKPIIKVYYCPNEIFKLLKSENSILESRFMLLNILEKLITPLNNSYYWYYYMKQFNIIVDNFKINKIKNINFDNKLNNIKIDIINILAYNKKILVIGDLAYKLINKIEIKKNIGIIEIMSCCILEELQNIFNYFVNKYKIKYKKINKCFIYLSYYYEFYIDNILIMKIYTINKYYNYLTINSYQVLNIHGQILFLLNKIIENLYFNKTYEHYEDLINNYLYNYKHKINNYEILQTNIVKSLKLKIDDNYKLSYNPINMTDFQMKNFYYKLNKIKLPELIPTNNIEKVVTI